ncbi:hypothetical protein DCAR_0207136 [Daucus carota subsp. sativus]|uniref:Uncharacterized protein n=1 Tax=Daucus carota subsp. sativus TaxID=79200 RepID=A0A166DNX0_DAUCS|nr:hypothetical protein DCAR_0207136 [Daucus carota subsp. sativus]
MGIAAPGFDVEGVMTMKNQDVFLSEASFITREPNQWYREPYASNAGADSTADFAQSV